MIVVRPLMKRGGFPDDGLVKKIPKAKPILSNKKRGTKCTNRRKAKK
jgi:hypothetical protein